MANSCSELIYTRLNSTLLMIERKKKPPTITPDNSIRCGWSCTATAMACNRPYRIELFIPRIELWIMLLVFIYTLIVWLCVRVCVFVWNVLLFRRISTKKQTTQCLISCVLIWLQRFDANNARSFTTILLSQ